MKIYEIFDVKRQEHKDIGIEIEVEGNNLKAPISRYWKVTQDGSLRGHSIEYVLKAPVAHKKTLHRLMFLKTELKDSRSTIIPSDRCGVHIHVNCQDMTTKQVINFAVVYLILEDLLVEMCGEDRVGNLFCLRASDADTIITGLRRCKEENSLNYMQNKLYRYASINMSAISKFGSVEFRAFKTPKDFEEIQKWIDILMRIKDYSLGFNEAYDIVENISFNGPEEFVRNVLKKEAIHLPIKGKEHLIFEGVRRVQEIAYARENKPKKEVVMTATMANWRVMPAVQPLYVADAPPLIRQWVVPDEPREDGN